MNEDNLYIRSSHLLCELEELAEQALRIRISCDKVIDEAGSHYWQGKYVAFLEVIDFIYDILSEGDF